MKIHKLSDKEISSLRVPIEKYEENLKFREFKEKATELLGSGNTKYLKYLLIIYVLIDLYRVSKNEEKNELMKLMEKFGLSDATIQKIDTGLKYGLPFSYLSALLLNKS
jgi:DNA-binding Xre family transcriptional regulator